MSAASRLQSAGFERGSTNPVVTPRGWYATPLMKNCSSVSESKNFEPLMEMGFTANEVLSKDRQATRAAGYSAQRRDIRTNYGLTVSVLEEERRKTLIVMSSIRVRHVVDRLKACEAGRGNNQWAPELRR